MPLSAPRPCNLPGCSRYSEIRGYCAEHFRAGRKLGDAERPSSYRRGYDRTWSAARAAYLRANPLCTSEEHRDRAVPATVVDHIVPISDAPHLRLVPSNWRSLCKPCHDSRTAREQSFGRRLPAPPPGDGSHREIWEKT